MKKRRIYGKVNIGIGVDYLSYTGNVLDALGDHVLLHRNAKKTNLSSLVNIGYSSYYKINNMIHIVIGLEMQWKYLFLNKNFLSFASANNFKLLYRFDEYFRSNLRLGAKINISKNVAFEPYALVGINIIAIKQSLDRVRTGEEKHTKSRLGLTTGAGINAIINDKYVVGVEYRYGMTRNSDNLFSLIKFKRISFNSVAIKLGVRF